jgi:hypothetical protein
LKTCLKLKALPQLLLLNKNLVNNLRKLARFTLESVKLVLKPNLMKR